MKTIFKKDGKFSNDWKLFWNVFGDYAMTGRMPAILFVFAILAALWIFQKGLWLAIQNNPILSVFIFLMALVIWRLIKADNEKDRRTRQRADEVLELYKSKHLGE